jgi:hypothetical protein
VIADLGTITSKLYGRWGWKCIPPLVLGWAALWPVGLAWLALSLTGAYRDRDRSPETQVERRVARLLSLYPPRWQSRYGPEFTALLRETIRSGHGGPRLTLNVVREGTAAWWQTREGRQALLPATCWWMCWIPLVAQGVAPLVVKACGGTYRSWFAALYLPGALQWPAIAIMFIAGFAMLGIAIRGTPALRQNG